MGIVINIKIIYVILVVGYVYVVSCLWEGDVYMYGVQGGCKDIVYQFIYNNFNIQVRVFIY